jgi:hypothetical protein
MSTTRSRVCDLDNDTHPQPNASSVQPRACRPPREPEQRGSHRAWRQDVEISAGPSPAGCCPGVATLDRVEAILGNPAVYELAALVPRPRPGEGGRPRSYPDYMYLVYEALISVYGSARQVEAELAHRVVWKVMRRAVKRQFPDDPKMRLPSRPMRRHHYLYGRNRYLSSPAVLARLGRAHRELAATQARQLGLLDPSGPGSWTHPDLTRLLHADGKVISPLFSGRLGDKRADHRTGAVRQVRYEPDASLHFEGGGTAAFGTKFVLVAARSAETRGRIILDVEWVPSKQQEAAVAMRCFARLRPLLPGAQGVIYDTALRGVHHQTLLRELGLLPISRVSGAAHLSKELRSARGRHERTIHLEDRPIILGDGSVRVLRLVARGGAIGLEDSTGDGNYEFVKLRRVRTLRFQDKSGLYRWYDQVALPDAYGGKTIMVRLQANEFDAARKFNRTEHVRPIPPDDPDFKRLYGRRSDVESINRGLEDSLYLRRAHSVGHAHQHVNLLGYALMVNSLALDQHHRRQPSSLAA